MLALEIMTQHSAHCCSVLFLGCCNFDTPEEINVSSLASELCGIALLLEDSAELGTATGSLSASLTAFTLVLVLEEYCGNWIPSCHFHFFLLVHYFFTAYLAQELAQNPELWDGRASV